MQQNHAHDESPFRKEGNITTTNPLLKKEGCLKGGVVRRCGLVMQRTVLHATEPPPSRTHPPHPLLKKEGILTTTVTLLKKEGYPEGAGRFAAAVVQRWGSTWLVTEPPPSRTLPPHPLLKKEGILTTTNPLLFKEGCPKGGVVWAAEGVARDRACPLLQGRSNRGIGMLKHENLEK